MSTPDHAPSERSVVCAGILVADHLCTPIAHFPAAGELVAADELVLNVGGCASNAAAALDRMGVGVAICGKVGNDVFGRFVAESLVRFGVNVSALAVDPQLATSQTLIVNVKGQDRRFIRLLRRSGKGCRSRISTVFSTRRPRSSMSAAT